MNKFASPVFAVCLSIAIHPGCSDEDAAQADRLGVGAQCSQDADCDQSTVAQVCLRQFKGGYCGVVDCSGSDDCPDPSACVQHEDGQRYCFRSCSEKLECNANRTPENESNCVSNVTYVGSTPGAGKSCVPPSSGTD